MKKNKRNSVLLTVLTIALIIPTILLVGYISPPETTYADPPGNIWGVSTGDTIRWEITDEYGLNTIDTNGYIDYSKTNITYNHIGNSTEEELNYTFIFYNTTYTYNNMSFYFQYTNGSGETFEKIRIYRYYMDFFDYISQPTIEYNITEVGSDGKVWFNFSAQHPYMVNLNVRVYTNNTNYYNQTSGRFLVHPKTTEQYKEYSMDSKVEVMKIEDSPTDADNLTDVYLMSSYVVGDQGITFDVPNYLDTGIIVWLLEVLGVLPPTDTFLHFPSAMRIVTSMIPQVLSGNQSFSFRFIELFTFANILMLPTDFNWTLITNLGNLINTLFGSKIITIINTTDYVGLEVAPNVIPSINDMQYGNASVSLLIQWNKNTGLLTDMGAFIDYYNVRVQRDIYIKLKYTSIPDDDIPTEPKLPETDINQTLYGIIIFLIIGTGVSASALGISIYNLVKKGSAVRKMRSQF